MTKDEVQIGGIYVAKVGKHAIEVQIKGAKPKGGWNAVAVATNKPMTIKDAKDLQPVAATPAEETGDSARTTTVDADGADVASDADVAPNRKRPGKKEPKPKTSKPAKVAKPAKEKAPAKEKSMSCLDAAAAVLKAKGEPMQVKPMIDAMSAQKLWSSDAPTPHATLFSALLREIKTRGAASRFKKVDRGQFEYQEPKGD